MYLVFTRMPDQVRVTVGKVLRSFVVVLVLHILSAD